MISNKRDLSSNAGLIMAQAALNYANDKGWEITVAVCDRSGVLIAFMRTDDVIPAAVEFAIDKAFTAATLGKATHEFGERMASFSWSFSGGRYTQQVNHLDWWYSYL